MFLFSTGDQTYLKGLNVNGKGQIENDTKKAFTRDVLLEKKQNRIDTLQRDLAEEKARLSDQRDMRSTKSIFESSPSEHKGNSSENCSANISDGDSSPVREEEEESENDEVEEVEKENGIKPIFSAFMPQGGKLLCKLSSMD